MPIPILVPVLAALALAAAGDDEESVGSGWTVDIGEDDLKFASDSEPGYVDVDLRERRVTAGISSYYERHEDPGDGVVRIRFTEPYRGSELAYYFRSPNAILIMEGMRSQLEVGDRGWSDSDSLVADLCEEDVGKFLSPVELIEEQVRDWHDAGSLLQELLEHGRRYFRWRGRGDMVVGGEDEEDEAVRRLLLSYVVSELLGDHRLTRSLSGPGGGADQGADVVDAPEEDSDVRQLLGLPALGFEILIEPLSDDPDDPESVLYAPVREEVLEELVTRLALEEVTPPEGWNRAYRFWVPHEAEEPPLSW